MPSRPRAGGDGKGRIGAGLITNPDNCAEPHFPDATLHGPRPARHRERPHPRRLPAHRAEAEALAGLLHDNAAELDAVVELNLPDGTVVKRLRSRQVRDHVSGLLPNSIACYAHLQEIQGLVRRQGGCDRCPIVVEALAGLFP